MQAKLNFYLAHKVGVQWIDIAVHRWLDRQRRPLFHEALVCIPIGGARISTFNFFAVRPFLAS